jgi:WD40 repeat protein
MIFESSIKDLKYSGDGRFLASICENSRITIHDAEKEYAPIKNIDYDFPNNNYFSLDFSQDGNLMANISTNANTITIWETTNFTLRYEMDLTGNLIYKIRFAPNNKDLVVLTTTSKLKFFRIGVGEISEYK